MATTTPQTTNASPRSDLACSDGQVHQAPFWLRPPEEHLQGSTSIDANLTS